MHFSWRQVMLAQQHTVSQLLDLLQESHRALQEAAAEVLDQQRAAAEDGGWDAEPWGWAGSGQDTAQRGDDMERRWRHERWVALGLCMRSCSHTAVGNHMRDRGSVLRPGTGGLVPPHAPACKPCLH